MIVGVIMYMIMCMGDVLDEEDWTGWSPVSPDTGAKPGHAMLPNMGTITPPRARHHDIYNGQSPYIKDKK